MTKIRVADYIANFIYDSLKVKDIFLVTGGGAMFLNDSIALHGKINPILNHHEQASAMGAVAYSKYKNSFACAMVTSGCGGTNTVTGVLDAWQDNTPVFFLSGQVKKKETVYNTTLPLRQYGVQEGNIVAIVKSITKYSIMVNEPLEIAYHLEKAQYLAKSGRPGPVWIDVPLDVQGATIDVDHLKHFDSKELELNYKTDSTENEIASVIADLKEAKRPIILAGNGIRLSDSVEDFKNFCRLYNLPVTTSYLGIDLLNTSSKLFVGRLGIKGDRAGNFALQNADYILVLGSRLSVALTGFEYKLFAREAKVTVVDIDTNEHLKNTVKIDNFINADVKNFLTKMNSIIPVETDNEWVNKCENWKKIWPVYLKKYESEENINKYTFIDYMCKYLNDDTTVVSDAGSAYYVTAQSLRIEKNQRFITSGAQADMGFTLPASIGVAVASKKDVVAITGDGSFQMNIQELQTIVQHQFPIKIFVWNNNGYLSIRTTQRKFFEGREMGTDTNSGISFPNLEKIANAYGIKYYIAKKVEDLHEVLSQVMKEKVPVICEIINPENQEIIPTVASMKKEDGSMVSKPIEDMYPFLDRDEFKTQMIISPLED
ncbi:MAG: thiamine pyrophosphate-binding protein [Sulfuricurvum sp.]